MYSEKRSSKIKPWGFRFQGNEEEAAKGWKETPTKVENMQKKCGVLESK